MWTTKCVQIKKYNCIRIIRHLQITCEHINLSCVATVVFSVRFLHAIAFSKKLPWFEPTNVISLKMQLHAVNACVKRSLQRSFKYFSKMRVPFFAPLLTWQKWVSFMECLQGFWSLRPSWSEY